MKIEKPKISTMRKNRITLFMWAEIMKEKYPELEMLFAVPFDAYKSVSSCKKFTEEGLKKGIPDVCLPISNGKFSSLWIKIKSSKHTKLTEKQKWWIKELNAKGCLAVDCVGWEAARDIILNYLNASKD